MKSALNPAFQVTAALCAPLPDANVWDAQAVAHVFATAEMARREPFYPGEKMTLGVDGPCPIAVKIDT